MSIKRVYELWVNFLDSVMRDIFLLVIRLYWGWSFIMTGKGKFINWDDTVAFFTSLGIPAPQINAGMAASTEFLGGVCLLLGLGSRIATVPLVFTMLVAYVTAHHAELVGIFQDPDAFLEAPPFLFLMTCLIVLFFGAGKYSIDAMLSRRTSGGKA